MQAYDIGSIFVTFISYMRKLRFSSGRAEVLNRVSQNTEEIRIAMYLASQADNQ